MPDGKKELLLYRLKSAKERLDSSRMLLDNGKLKDSINRSYYAMFISVRALFALEGVDFSKHSAVIAYFQKEYIKTGLFEKKYSKYISQAFQIRNNVDYADFFIVSQADAEEQYIRAEEFYEAVKRQVSVMEKETGKCEGRDWYEGDM